MRWSSRDLAKAIFGDGSRIPNTFACHRQTYRHDRVNHALDAVYGSAQPNYVDDGMDIDEDVFQQPALRPPHLLDDLHFQIIEHFSILLINLVKRVAPHIFHNQERAGSGASIHSPYSKPIQVWNARDCVEYLGNPGLLAFPQSAPRGHEKVRNGQRPSGIALCARWKRWVLYGEKHQFTILYKNSILRWTWCSTPQ